MSCFSTNVGTKTKTINRLLIATVGLWEINPALTTHAQL